eukprot:5333925-Amphidinium_carterae.1
MNNDGADCCDCCLKMGIGTGRGKGRLFRFVVPSAGKADAGHPRIGKVKEFKRPLAAKVTAPDSGLKVLPLDQRSNNPNSCRCVGGIDDIDKDGQRRKQTRLLMQRGATFGPR